MSIDVREVARLGLVVLLPLGVLAVMSGRVPFPALAAAAAALGIVLAWLAQRHPQLAVSVAVLVVVLVPYYDGRLVTRAMALTPMTASCLVLLPAAWAARGRVRLVPLDIAVGLLVLLRSLGLLFNFQNGFGALFFVVLQVALPYAVFRCLTLDRMTIERVAACVVGSAIVLSFVGIAEHGGTPNPFFTLLPADYQAGQWAHAETRAHSVRAEATFGHPIAFGMFLATALVFAVAMALTTERVWLRAVLLGSCGLMVLALADTLSRGPLIAAVLGTATWLLISARRLKVLRLAAVIALVAGVVVGTPVLGIVQHLVSASTEADSREGLSTQYRLEILAVAKDPAELSLLGRANENGGITQAVFDRTGLTSIDSEFALVYLTAGLLSLLAFFAVVLLAVRVVGLSGLSPVERAWAVAMAAACLNLLTVALLTQHGELFWSWIAVLAGIVQRHRQPALEPERERVHA